MMNVHHLELFYYVAKHGGISAAVRAIPYGIQQPAVSGQMRQLEDGVGAKLFERSPFRLTPAGEQLFAHIQPFFENLGAPAQPVLDHEAPEDPAYDPQEMYGIIPRGTRTQYDVREIIARLVDGSRLHEFKPLYATTLVT